MFIFSQICMPAMQFHQGKFMTLLSARFKQALRGTFKSLYTIMPMLFAVIGLIGLFQAVVTPKMLHSLFSGSPLQDTFVAAVAGGVSVGNLFSATLSVENCLQRVFHSAQSPPSFLPG
jgi:uncharacterized membrane protein YraQ (UPF0718 family)